MSVARQKFSALEQDFGTTVAEALWKKAVRVMNYVEKSYPVGYMLFVHGTQDNLPHLPDSKYWQEIDGSTISNANSLLNGVVLPDFRDKFFRNLISGETIFSAGGQSSVNIQHNHGGFTGFTDPRYAFDADGGSDRSSMDLHRHTIPNGGSTAASTIPRYIALKVYVRYI